MIHFALVSIASPLAQVLIAVSAIGFLVGHGSIEVYKAKQLLKKECALQERHLAKKFISDLSELKNRLDTLSNYLALSGSNKLIGYIKDNTENTAREYKQHKPTDLLDRLSLYEIRSETLARLDTSVDEVVSLLRQVSLLAMEIEIEKEADGEIIPTRISRRDKEELKVLVLDLMRKIDSVKADLS